MGNEGLSINLYRHPSRQGEYPEEEYIMQHDIYSLGVCLLEIGLGTSFVPKAQGIDGAANEDESLALGLNDVEVHRPSHAAYSRKSKLLELATDNLRRMMGPKYTDLAISGITCLNGNSTFGNMRDLYDKDGILVGVRYIEKVRHIISIYESRKSNNIRFRRSWRKLQSRPSGPLRTFFSVDALIMYKHNGSNCFEMIRI
jgi:hypothetical protein